MIHGINCTCDPVKQRWKSRGSFRRNDSTQAGCGFYFANKPSFEHAISRGVDAIVPRPTRRGEALPLQCAIPHRDLVNRTRRFYIHIPPIEVFQNFAWTLTELSLDALHSGCALGVLFPPDPTRRGLHTARVRFPPTGAGFLLATNRRNTPVDGCQCKELFRHGAVIAGSLNFMYRDDPICGCVGNTLGILAEPDWFSIGMLFAQREKNRRAAPNTSASPDPSAMVFDNTFYQG